MIDSRKTGKLGINSLIFERETSTGVLANFSRELANSKRELAKSKRKFAWFKRRLAAFMPIIPRFDQLYPGNRKHFIYNSKNK